jgi:titin
LEAFEDRLLLTTFPVTDPGNAGLHTLRQAILDSNGTPGLNRIEFAVGGGGVQTIHLTAALPTITVPVAIDGATQPGFTGSPLIVLDGSSAGPGVNGLTIAAGSSTVRALVINGFRGDGIHLQAPGSDVIAGNYLGTDVTGTAASANGGNGVSISAGSANNTIGGTAAGAGNLVAANAGSGVSISGGSGGNLVQGNRIGTDVSGTQALANQNGVALFSGAIGNTIGGTLPGARNVLSGNRGYGLDLIGSGTAGNGVRGNFIGTDAAGTAALPNGDRGVIIQNGAADNTVGGAAGGAGNLISGNTGRGVDIFGGGTTGNQVLGNYIGTTVDGTAALPNSDDGVAIDFGATADIIGGTAGGAGNLISGNTNNGIEIFGNGAANNQVLGNLIGTDVTGTQALGNGRYGLAISDMAMNNTIGGTASGARNIISANNFCGIILATGAASNVVQGNYIGTDLTGTQALGNGSAGYVAVAVVDAGTSNNLIGGTVPGAGNLISGNPYNALRITAGASNTLVQGNSIGTDVTGTLALANGSAGGTSGAVLIDSGAINTTIGGTVPGAGNVISGNAVNGIHVEFSGTIATVVQGNFIGTDVSGTSALPNMGDGVLISDGASGNLIGGTIPGAGNVISGNLQDGIHFANGATANTVQGNRIGTDVSGTLALGNGLNGVHFEDTSDNNAVGGTQPEAANTIAYNGNDGVLVDTATGDAILGNAILGNAILGHSAGLGIELLNGGNNSQAAPVLTAVTTGGGTTTVTGVLLGAPDTAFTLEFFADTVCNPSGFGEGESLLGDLTVTTDADGNASFTFTCAAVPSGQFVAATATDPAGNTSAFSACAAAPGPVPGGAGGPGRPPAAGRRGGRGHGPGRGAPFRRSTRPVGCGPLLQHPGPGAVTWRWR